MYQIISITFKKNIKYILVFLLLISTYLYFNNSTNIENFDRNHKFSSECDCRRNENIYVLNSRYSNSVDILLSSDNSSIVYNLEKFESSVFSCDLYNVLRRGKDIKVIGFSLYGKNSFYYKHLKTISKSIQSMYPGWIMRVYHDDSINPNTKCELECLKDENNVLIDNTDFCNIQNMPLKGSFNKTWDAKYIHAMMWRWFPIGDTFVKIFSSRDSDSIIIPREIDSVNVWLNSSKPGHIMRGKNFSNN